LDFRKGKSQYFPRDSLVSGNFGDSFSYAICYYLCARIYFVELKYSQLKINHLNDTPSAKAVGGRIYSGVFDKDVKVPVKVTRRSLLVPLLPTITMLVQAFFEELLRKNACLRGAIHSFLDFD
jgi:hypothetical protein